MSDDFPFRVAGAGLVRDDQTVLSGVDLAVPPGEFLALLGENGSGKSTLLRVMLGLLPLTSGEARVFGTPVAQYRDWDRIGYVPQNLFAAGAVPVSVREVVEAGLITPRTRWQWRGRRTEVQAALAQVGLWERRGDAFHTLSGGQQRRVMIAAALAKRSDVLVVDEPTAGVDARNVARLAQIFADLKATGATVVLVTHELGQLADLVSRVIVLGSQGGASIRYDGPPPAPPTFADPHGHHETPHPHPPGTWELGT